MDPLNEDERTFVEVGEAFREALDRRGADTTYPRTLPHRLASIGLVEVGASGHVTSYRGGSPESQVMISNLDQVGAGTVEAGLVTSAELDTARRLLDDPAFVGNYPLLITAWGHRPTS